VRTLPTIPMDLRPRERCSVCGIREIANNFEARAKGFPAGTPMRIVEFEGGDGIEMTEEYLAPLDE
jgi:hypothetical protein